MLEFLRRRGTTKSSDSLSCPRCGSSKLKLVDTQGFDLDIYRCCNEIRNPYTGKSQICNTPIRYMTKPLDTTDQDRLKNRGEMLRGMHHKEVSELGAIQRARKQGKVYLPGIGTYRMRSSKACRKIG